MAGTIAIYLLVIVGYFGFIAHILGGGLNSIPK
jgi:hypothetical protein